MKYQAKLYFVIQKHPNLESIRNVPECVRTHLQQCRNSNIFRGRNPRTPAPKGGHVRRGQGPTTASNAAVGGGERTQNHQLLSSMVDVRDLASRAVCSQR